jgi:Phage T7 capsid assembly protein.
VADSISVSVSEEASDPTKDVSHVTEERVDGGKVEKVNVGEPAKPETPADSNRPAWLPEKFKSPEDLAKAYGELETKLGKGEKPAEAKPETAAEQTPEKLAEAKGVDLGALYTEFAEKGALSEDSYKALAEKGFDKATVDAHIEGQKARADAYTNKLAEQVGGREKLDSLLKWAGDTLTAEQAASVDQALQSGDEAFAGLALRGLLADYTAKVGKDPDLVEGSTGSVAGVKPFGSNAELVRAMSDKRYKEGDPAYHAEIDRRLAITPMAVNAR